MRDEWRSEKSVSTNMSLYIDTNFIKDDKTLVKRTRIEMVNARQSKGKTYSRSELLDT